MKISTQSAPGPKGPPSILLRGSPGAHKTSLALLFPNPGIVDCDENLRGPEEYIRKFVKPDLEYRYHRVRYDDQDKPTAEPREWWPRFVLGFNSMVIEPWVKTIVTDSLTGLDEVLLRKTMDQQGRKEEMQIQDWIPFRLKLRDMMFKMRQTGKTNIVICHEEAKRNKQQEITGYDVFLSSKLSEIFGWVFTDVWFIEAQPDIGGQKRPSKLWCSPVGLRSDLKSSNPDMPQCIEVKPDAKGLYDQGGLWTEVNKYLKL